MCLAVGGLVVVGDGHGRVTAAPSAQALRTCVDRCNQNNMVGWGSMSVRVAIRGLTARERTRLSIPDPGRRRCTVSLARPAGRQHLDLEGFQNLVHAAARYSWMSPPRRSWRSIVFADRSFGLLLPAGGRRASARCGRSAL